MAGVEVAGKVFEKAVGVIVAEEEEEDAGDETPLTAEEGALMLSSFE